jgi:mRNA interferase YafQ
MPKRHADHPLRGELQGYRECHIEPDWLFIYQIIEDGLILLAAGTGTHFDLFDE